jgi:hypothetical protein
MPTRLLRNVRRRRPRDDGTALLQRHQERRRGELQVGLSLDIT